MLSRVHCIIFTDGIRYVTHLFGDTRHNFDCMGSLHNCHWGILSITNWFKDSFHIIHCKDSVYNIHFRHSLDNVHFRQSLQFCQCRDSVHHSCIQIYWRIPCITSAVWIPYITYVLKDFSHNLDGMVSLHELNLGIHYITHLFNHSLQIIYCKDALYNIHCRDSPHNTLI